MKPRLLDLFCGAGGAAMGYHRAGFDVVGVDVKFQRRYPFAFVQADALAFLAAADLSLIAAIHASPPCEFYCRTTPRRTRERHPDLIGPTRAALTATGLPWVIENIPDAPVRPDFLLCGCLFALPRLKRERRFETNWSGPQLRAACHHPEPPVTVCGHGINSHSRYYGKINGREFSRLCRLAMGIDWMTRDQLAKAIPPAYTEHIGTRLLDHLAMPP